MFWFWLFACTPPPPADPPIEGTETPPAVERPAGPAVVINEVMARNVSTWLDDQGQTSDWIELLNVGDEPVALNRLELLDEGDGHWFGGAGTLEPGERLLLTASLDPGGLGFALNSAGDGVALAADGYLIDQVQFESLPPDTSLARIPDGGEFVVTAWPTPGEDNGDVASATTDAADATLFVTDRVHQIDLSVTAEAYQDLSQGGGFFGLDRNYIEVEAELVIDGWSYPAVGLRRKGSASSDPLTGKPPFRVDLNAFVPGTRFRTLKGFGLHNGKIFDPTMTRDHITYTLAREAGLPAPRVGWAQVTLNGETLGLYILVESHDSVMIERNFPGQAELGMMLEPNEKPDGGIGFGDFGRNTPWDYETGPTPADPLAQLSLDTMHDLVNGPASDAAVQQLWTVCDRDNLLTYMAWEHVTGHTDGYHSPNNWRVFVHSDTKLVHLVPSGAEWTWETSPGLFNWGGALASWCIRNNGCKADYAARVVEVSDLVDNLDLRGEFEAVYGSLQQALLNDPRSKHSNNTITNTANTTAGNLVSFPNRARNEVCQAYPGQCP